MSASRATAPAATSGTAPSQARRDAVDKARQSWIRKLIDLSRRNNLLYYRPLKTGTLDLSSADSTAMAALLSGAEPVSLNRLVQSGKDDSVTALVRSIARRAQANAEEKGLQTLFVALGMATWVAEDGGRPADSPVLLFPIALETKGSQSFSIRRAGDVQFNQVLSHVLETQFGVVLDHEALLSTCFADDEGEELGKCVWLLESSDLLGHTFACWTVARKTRGLVNVLPAGEVSCAFVLWRSRSRQSSEECADQYKEQRPPGCSPVAASFAHMEFIGGQLHHRVRSGMPPGKRRTLEPGRPAKKERPDYLHVMSTTSPR